MKDPRVKQLAELLVNYSVKAQAGEKILIGAIDASSLPLVDELIEAIVKAKAIPFVSLTTQSIQRKLFKYASDPMLDILCKTEVDQVKYMDAYIGVRAIENKFETNDVDQKQMMNVVKKYRKILSNAVTTKKWVTLMFPTPAFAQASNMSIEAFENFFFDVTTLDYEKMDNSMNYLKELMEKSDRVHIKGPGKTDLRFSIKGMPAIKCSGACNIPDGEIYTAPVIDSVEGIIEYNTPSIYLGTKFDKVILAFKEGKIVKYEGSAPEKLDEIFNSDEGAKFVGEFSFGLNPYIVEPTVNILFDEKISGSIHFTPGNAYKNCDNGNRSSIHWDLVMIQTPRYGGGEIYFDDILIRKEGLFVLPELLCLNPENLK